MSKTKFKSTRLIGISLPNKTSNKNGQSNIDIGQLWQKFEAGNFFTNIPGKTGNSIYAVYYNYEGDHTAPFSYFIGCPVSKETRLPDGLTELTIDEGEFEKVLAKGPMPGCIGQAWQKIWESDIPRAFKADFEVYDERSADWNDAEVDIFISVK